MKKKLAIFDFDSTIKQHGETFTLGGRAKLFPNQKIPEEFFDVYNEVHGTFYDLVKIILVRGTAQKGTLY